MTPVPSRDELCRLLPGSKRTSNEEFIVPACVGENKATTVQLLPALKVGVRFEQLRGATENCVASLPVTDMEVTETEDAEMFDMVKICRDVDKLAKTGP